MDRNKGSLDIYSDQEEVYYTTLAGKKRSPSVIQRTEEQETHAYFTQGGQIQNKNNKKLMIAVGATFIVCCATLVLVLYQVLMQSCSEAVLAQGSVSHNVSDILDGDSQNQEDGWVLIQKRGQYKNPEDYFVKNFDEYQSGFGNKNEEYWIGLQTLSKLTGQGRWELRVYFLTWLGEKFNAIFHQFKVGKGPKFELNTGQYDDYSTIDGHFLLYHNKQAFSTVNVDQDDAGTSCSELHGRGGWWFKSCYWGNLNGLNRNPDNKDDAKAIRIYNDGRSMTNAKYAKETVMQIRKVKHFNEN